MNNKTIAIIVGVIVILGVAYVGRKAIKGMYAPTPTTENTSGQMAASPSSATTNNTGSSLYMMKTSAKLGQYITDPKGMTLYTYTKDTAGVSNCTGQCLANWPAYAATNAPTNLPANFGTIKRADGTMQYTWKEMPLYYFVKDTTAGDTTGDGVGGVWYVAK